VSGDGGRLHEDAMVDKRRDRADVGLGKEKYLTDGLDDGGGGRAGS
jgi:hypothetical protein